MALLGRLGVLGEEALRRGQGLEALHLPLASSDRKMRVFGAVVFAQPTRPMTILQAKHAQSGNDKQQASVTRQRRARDMVWNARFTVAGV